MTGISGTTIGMALYQQAMSKYFGVDGPLPPVRDARSTIRMIMEHRGISHKIKRYLPAMDSFPRMTDEGSAPDSLAPGAPCRP